MERALYSVAEIAELTGVKPKTLYGIISRGEIRAIRIGRQLRITRAELERVLGIFTE